mgnify:CR=1 FL=1
MSQKSYDKSPTLYLIPTPIGNLEDITLRAINILKEVEVIFCEDTRVTALLLNHLNIKKRLISSHKFNESMNDDKLLEYLNKGVDVGLVTDRGTPIISDPGYELVKVAINNHFNVVALPGPTAFVPALIASGLSPQPFLFYGFLNSKESKMKYIDMLTSLKNRNYLNDNIEKWDDAEIYPQTIIIVDLNNIAYINDNYGHNEGDNIIKDAANILIKTQLANTEIFVQMEMSS